MFENDSGTAFNNYYYNDSATEMTFFETKYWIKNVFIPNLSQSIKSNDLHKLPQVKNKTMATMLNILACNPLFKPFFHHALLKFVGDEVISVRIKFIDDTDALIVVKITKKEFQA